VVAALGVKHRPRTMSVPDGSGPRLSRKPPRWAYTADMAHRIGRSMKGRLHE
jgi:hypothetical protein